MTDELARVQDHPVFGFLSVRWEVVVDDRYDSHPRVRNVTEHAPGEAAFYEVPSLYPATVVQARYGGTYEGGRWLAFPCYPHNLFQLCRYWDGDDIVCAEFWGDVRQDPVTWPIGRGPTPSAAYDDLVLRVEAAAAA